jgi:predicted SnoaL-like aldol condensation-catalyzing enzyme
MPLRSLPLLALISLLGATNAGAQLPVEVHPNQTELLASADPTLAANKKLVFDFWRTVMQAHEAERAAEFVADSYVRHGAELAPGRAGLAEWIGRLPRAALKPTIDELVAIVAERDLVTLAFRRKLPDLANEGQTYTTTGFDLFRVEAGKIVEHWDYDPRD